MAETLKEHKAALRSEYRARRNNLADGFRSGADEAIFRHLTALPEYRAAETVFAYVSVAGEADTRRLIGHALAQGKRVAVPRVTPGRPGVMDICRLHSPEALAPGAFGLPEPTGDCETISPADIDLALVPALSCDKSGARLGQGGGYYDRVLAGRRFPAVALLYGCCVADTLPCEAFDSPVDMLVTEHGIIACDEGGRPACARE